MISYLPNPKNNKRKTKICKTNSPKNKEKSKNYKHKPTMHSKKISIIKIKNKI